MKQFSTVLFLFGILTSTLAYAQTKNPVSVSFNAEKAGANIYDLNAHLVIKDGWHIYALQGGEGPVSSSFDVYKIEKNPWLEQVGKTEESGKLISVFEDVFDSDVRYFENKVTFTNRIKKAAKQKIGCVPVSIEYMVCNEHSCLPPTTRTSCIVLK